MGKARWKAGQGRAGQGRAGQGRAGQGRAGQGRAGQARPGQARPGQARPGQGMVSKQKDEHIYIVRLDLVEESEWHRVGWDRVGGVWDKWGRVRRVL